MDNTNQKMMDFALRHNVGDSSVLPEIFDYHANLRGVTTSSLIDMVERKPAVADYFAQMARHLSTYRKYKLFL